MIFEILKVILAVLLKLKRTTAIRNGSCCLDRIILVVVLLFTLMNLIARLHFGVKESLVFSFKESIVIVLLTALAVIQILPVAEIVRDFGEFGVGYEGAVVLVVVGGGGSGGVVVVWLVGHELGLFEQN